MEGKKEPYILPPDGPVSNATTTSRPCNSSSKMFCSKSHLLEKRDDAMAAIGLHTSPLEHLNRGTIGYCLKSAKVDDSKSNEKDAFYSETTSQQSSALALLTSSAATKSKPDSEFPSLTHHTLGKTTQPILSSVLPRSLWPEDTTEDTNHSNYRDCSRDPIEDLRDPSVFLQASLSQKEAPFPVKLHRILCNSEFQDIISWSPHGRSWRVLQPKAFEERVIPAYFRHSRYSSFMRQVNGWGFKRIYQGADLNSYYHELFLEGLPHLCLKMRRPSSKQAKQNIQDAAKTQAPDFYAISEKSPLPRYASGFQLSAVDDAQRKASNCSSSELTSSNSPTKSAKREKPHLRPTFSPDGKDSKHLLLVHVSNVPRQKVQISAIEDLVKVEALNAEMQPQNRQFSAVTAPTDDAAEAVLKRQHMYHPGSQVHRHELFDLPQMYMQPPQQLLNVHHTSLGVVPNSSSSSAASTRHHHLSSVPDVQNPLLNNALAGSALDSLHADVGQLRLQQILAANGLFAATPMILPHQQQDLLHLLQLNQMQQRSLPF